MGFVTHAIAITLDDVAAHYDDLDRFYRAVWGEHVHHGLWRDGGETPEEAADALARHVGERLALRSGARVCDIGCGYGATAHLLTAERGVRVTGFTLSMAQARIARARGTDVAVRDWLGNGLEDACFDAAYAIESSEHMPDLARFFAQAERVLKPGGRFVVCAWLARDHPAAWEVRHLLEPICREGRLCRLGTETDYRRLIEASGLRLVEVEDLTRAVRRTWSVCLYRLLGLLLRDAEARRFLRDSASAIESSRSPCCGSFSPTARARSATRSSSRRNPPPEARGPQPRVSSSTFLAMRKHSTPHGMPQ
jgi:tocopherol O-methyltransferase